jgi:5-methylcytosine-specific restriction enzyme subunit McrC
MARSLTASRRLKPAKYKRTTSDDYPNADAYQMLAYCTRLELQRGLLVYADIDGQSIGSTVIRNAGIEIVVTALDIRGSIEDLRSSVTALANLVAASTGLPSVV